MAVLLTRLQQVSVFSDINRSRRYDLFTDGIDGRIGHLREHLLEIIKQRPVFFGKYCQRRIAAHCTNAFRSIQRHIQDGGTILLIGITECFLQSCSLFRRIFDRLMIRDMQIL